MKIPRDEVPIATIKTQRILHKTVANEIKVEKCTMNISVMRTDDEKFVVLRFVGNDERTRNKIALKNSELKEVIKGLNKALDIINLTL